MHNRFYNEFDSERSGQLRGDDDDYRSAFQRDRDGVIYSSAFRRLQAKTQVFLSGQYDFYRTRLTHSIEVAQIGRSICNRLLARGAPLAPDFRIDPDLVESICLAHDLGHPPFGHAGERTLHRLMRDGYGGFEGNAQSLRIVGETIYSAGSQRRGLRPTRAFVDGILKYKRLWSDDRAADNHFLYDEQRSWREFALPDWERGRAAGGGADWPRSIECQIMDWADDTAYSVNDIADGVNAGFLDYVRIARWGERAGLDDAASGHLGKLLEALRDGFIDAWAGKRVGRFVKACRIEERGHPLAARSNRHRFALAVAPEARAEAELYKRLSVELVFRSPKIRQLEYKGDYILERVFRALENAYIHQTGAAPPGLLPESFHRRATAAASAHARARLLCDYLAGMTDGFATRTFKRLFDPDFGSISELA